MATKNTIKAENGTGEMGGKRSKAKSDESVQFE